MSAQPTLELPVAGRAPALPWVGGRASSLRRNTIGIIGIAVILTTVATALLGPAVWRADYASQAARRLLPPRTCCNMRSCGCSAAGWALAKASAGQLSARSSAAEM